MDKYHKIIIVGCGPAGIAAAIQLKRSGMNPLVIEKERIGGLLCNASLVENYPGFPGGIIGVDLVNLLDDHLKQLGVKISFEKVVQLEIATEDEKKLFSGDSVNFTMRTADKKYYSTYVIIATGTRPKKLAIDFSTEIEENVFYEIFPLLEANNGIITVIGAGDAAFDYSLSLSKNNKVILLNRSNKTKALVLLEERVAADNNIEYLTNNKLVDIQLDEKKCLKLEIEDANNNKWYQSCDYLVIAIGRDPETSFLSTDFEEQLVRLVDCNLVHFIGDVKGSYRQTAIAVGDGIRTAMKIALEGAITSESDS